MYSGNILEIKNKTGASITFDGESYAAGSFVPVGRMLTYKATGCKLWGSDTGRSMTGANKGTLVGIFPKLEIEMPSMSEDNLSAIIALTDQAETTVKYYDVRYKTLKENSFYFGDVPWNLIDATAMQFGSASFSVIANTRR